MRSVDVFVPHEAPARHLIRPLLNCNMTPKVFEKFLLNLKVCICTVQDKKLKTIIS